MALRGLPSLRTRPIQLIAVCSIVSSSSAHGCGQELYFLALGKERQNPFDGTNGFPSRKKAASKLRRPKPRCDVLRSKTRRGNVQYHLYRTFPPLCRFFCGRGSRLCRMTYLFSFKTKSFIHSDMEVGNAICFRVWRRQTRVENGTRGSVFKRTRMSDVQTRPYRSHTY